MKYLDLSDIFNDYPIPVDGASSYTVGNLDGGNFFGMVIRAALIDIIDIE